MEVSPNSETKPRVRRRLIQSTLFPHKPQDNGVGVDEDLEPDAEQEDGEEEYCETEVKKSKKRKPKAASQSRASRKITLNGNEAGVKNSNEEDSPVTVKVDFFVKVSERRHQQRQQKEQLSTTIHSPENNEQCCSPPDVITNSKSPRKPRRRASATPKKRQTCATPERRQMNSTPSRNAVNGGLHEDYSEKMLASPPKPIPDLRLEAKMTAEENSRIFAGKQIHPFFASWKNGKKNTESIGTENKWCHVERKESNKDVNPVHVFEKTQSETFSVDWRNWTFSESIFTRAGRDLEDSCLHLINEGSVNCLQFDNFLGAPQLGISLCQNKGSSSEYPIQLEEISSSFCSMLQEKILVTSSDFLVEEPQCNQPKDVEVVHEIGKTGGSLENTEFVVNLDTQLLDTLHSERMTSKYHDYSYQPENSLWTTKYQPERAVEICGNHESVKFLNEWLRQWHEKGSRTTKCSMDNDKWIMQDVDLNYSPSDYSSEYIDEETTLKNVLLVTGPVGSGKSAAIYACAKEQGFQIIEVNTSDWRNGALVKQKFGEAVESHWLQRSMPNIENPDNKDQLKSSKAIQRSSDDVIELIPSSDDEDLKIVGGTAVKPIDKENKVSGPQTGTKTLILFEDVDATLCEDRGFVSTIQQLAETAKRPMILTSNSDDPDLPSNLDRIEISFRIPSSEELLSLASLVCTAEKAEIERCLVERCIDHCQGDIRKTIMLLQFWCQGQNQRKESEVRNTYAPLLFDTNAGHHVLPQLIPSGHASKLSETIENEITKSTLLLAKDTGLMETIEEEEENNIDLNVDIERNHIIEAKKDEMLRRHCSDQDENDFAARCTTVNEHPASCSSSPVAFVRRTLQKKHDAITNTDPETFLNEGIPDILEDVNEEVGINAKRTRRKYNAVASDSEEDEGFDEGLRVENVEVNADEKLSEMENGHVLFNGEKLEESCHPSEIPCFNSKIDDDNVDVSCVPESSYVPETEIEIGNETTMWSTMCSSGRVDGGIEEGPTSADCLPEIVPLELDKVPVIGDSGLDTAPGHGEEIGDSHVEPMETRPREYQTMDECSRIDFDRKPESVCRPKPVETTDLIQETWRKLRNCDDEFRKYVSIEEKETLEALRISYGMTNLISEADLLLADCQSLTCDYVKPSMVSTEESHSFSWHDDQLQMASTIAQHGFCLFAKRSLAAGSSPRMDLASEMLAASTSAISLGKLINRNNTTVKSNGKKTLQSGVSLKSMLDSPLSHTVQSIVPLRSQLSLRGYVFHEYLSSLAQISRSESARLSEAVNKSNQRRKRVARNYLSNGSLALSSEDISLLDRFSCHRKATES